MFMLLQALLKTFLKLLVNWSLGCLCLYLFTPFAHFRHVFVLFFSTWFNLTETSSLYQDVQISSLILGDFLLTSRNSSTSNNDILKLLNLSISLCSPWSFNMSVNNSQMPPKHSPFSEKRKLVGFNMSER